MLEREPDQHGLLAALLARELAVERQRQRTARDQRSLARGLDEPASPPGKKRQDNEHAEQQARRHRSPFARAPREAGARARARRENGARCRGSRAGGRAARAAARRSGNGWSSTLPNAPATRARSARCCFDAARERRILLRSRRRSPRAAPRRARRRRRPSGFRRRSSRRIPSSSKRRGERHAPAREAAGERADRESPAPRPLPCKTSPRPAPARRRAAVPRVVCPSPPTPPTGSYCGIDRRNRRMFAAVFGQRDFTAPAASAPVVNPRVFHDAEHPAREIRAGLVLIEMAPRALHRRLHEIVGVVLVARQRAREAAQPRQQRDDAFADFLRRISHGFMLDHTSGGVAFFRAYRASRSFSRACCASAGIGAVAAGAAAAACGCPA